jgi:hypothetical protein
MSSYIHRSSDLDRGFSRREDPEEVHRARTRRLVAKLFRVVRPTLATQPPRRENVYIALDAVAWAAAMILTGSEDRDALDFFTLALTQNLARFEARNDVNSHRAVPANAGSFNQALTRSRIAPSPLITLLDLVEPSCIPTKSLADSKTTSRGDTR